MVEGISGSFQMRLPNHAGLKTYPPATEETLSDLERRLGYSLPVIYRRFLLQADGFSLDGGLLMYGTDIIEERNSTYEVAIYAPGYLAIGGTGGGEAIMIRQDDDNAALLIVDVGAMTPDMMRELAPGLEQWLEAGCELPED
jgi:hypothetical protein